MSDTNLPPDVDPAARIPASVRANADAVAAFYAQQNATENPADELAAPEEAKSSDTSFDAPAPESVDLTAEQEKPKRDGKVTDWEGRYKAMKGRYDSAQQHISRLTEQVTTLQNMIASLDQPRHQEAETERYISDKEREEFGEDFLSVVGKKAKEELSPEVKSLKQQVASLQQQLSQVTGTVTQSSRQEMYRAMDGQLPSWRELNNDPEFLNWLRLPDTYSGAIRHELLKAAFERNDSGRVLAFFNGFLAEEAAVAPAAEAETHQNKVPLEKFAAPGRAKTAAANSGPTEKPFVTRAEITKFYADSAQNRYVGREKEYKQTEAKIAAALREGRVR